MPEMNYCMQCGTKPTKKYLASEGKEIPYCEKCEDFRFPVMDVHENEEIDSYNWFTIEGARDNICRPSLAACFLDGYLTGTYSFNY